MIARAHHKILFALPILVACLCLCACASEQFQWYPPKGGVIRDKAAAISIAGVIWQSMNPQFKVPPDAVWQKGMTAKLEDGVWHVGEKLPSGPMIGGGFAMDLSARDGRVVSMIFTQ